ncbi:response regulator [Paludicola sp. MB14-C6]|uniref:response regulator n=1 Tax=Paludihabitans sp. MB14-C6 TaxID=3070656 RepID=UPI0027DC2136|nr:response regulator [Paludicola sp. MB14-C6]WMJ23535.1 response regulator [Paludicola sp. MB14-C6]
MYSLIIVEDEPIEREALKLLIRNNFPNIEIVGEAANGFEAMDLYKIHCPDIMMVDINMPGITGLQTIKEIKSLNCKTKFIILTSYSKFEYAKEAIHLGVEDFILKPTNIAQITEIFKNLTNKLDEQKSKEKINSELRSKLKKSKDLIESDCVLSFVSGITNEKSEQICEVLDMNIKSGFCIIVNIKDRRESLLFNIKMNLVKLGFNCIGKIMHNYIVFFILSQEILEARRMKEITNFICMLIKESLPDKEFYISAGSIYESIMQFHVSYFEALTANKYAKQNNTNFALYQDIKDSKMNTEVDFNFYVKKISGIILQGEEDNLGQIIDNFTIELTQCYEQDWSIAIQSLYKFSILLEKEVAVNNSLELFSDDQLKMQITNIKNFNDIKLYLSLFIDKIYNSVKICRSYTVNTQVNTALDYIRQNFNKNISLDDVAKHLNISSYYASKLIKKYMAKNFTDILTEYRIDNAKKLLSTTSLTKKEITYQSGFNSQHYFANIFKKYVGITPSEYRNMVAMSDFLTKNNK